MLVAIYCIFFMGGCSPIHFRSAAAGITLLCVGLSYAGSSGLAFYLGAHTAGIHNLLPFLLIGIGVDDMFVIASAIDQTDSNESVENRIKVGMIHAGSSITITSFTNAIAFFLGCTTSLDALGSFCFFAGLGVLFLYFSSISIFASFMVWDLKRQYAQKGDCCGACCCSEENIICCKGYFLTEK
jgi:Niemann-Pick C1 protein